MNEYNVVNRANIRSSFDTALIVNFSFLLFLVPNGPEITSEGGRGGWPMVFSTTTTALWLNANLHPTFKGTSSIYTVKLYAKFS